MEGENLPANCIIDKFPNQSKFIFENIKFDSDFDSGNLLNVEKVNDFEFNLWVSADCQGTQSVKNQGMIRNVDPAVKVRGIYTYR